MSVLQATVHVGAIAPYALRYRVTTTDSTINLASSNVTAAHYRVQRPNGDEASWVCEISEQSATSLLLTHIFDNANIDVPVAGPYAIEPRLTTSEGDLVSAVATLTVRPKFT